MANSHQTPAARPPGLDPYWREVASFDFTIVSVLAPCDQVLEALPAATDNLEEPPRDCLREEITIAAEAWDRAIFVYQLKGSPWTHVHPLRNRVGISTGLDLSKALNTKALIYAYQDTASGFLYTFAENGAEVEEFYLGDLMEDVAKLNADGWQVHGYVNLRTKRMDGCDVDSPEAKELPDTIAKDLGVYVPGEVWTVDPESGRVGLEQPWSKSDFADARLLLSSW